MLEIRDKNASTSEARQQNISLWQDADITSLNSKAKKRFSKHKSAIVAYFTSDKPIEEIATQYNLSTEQLLNMTTNCLKQHEDGSLWGYRALLPGVLVKDYSSNSASVPTEAEHSSISDAPSIQEPLLDPANDDDNHDATAKRPAIASARTAQSTDVLSPIQSTGSKQTNSTDYVQNQQPESALMPLEDISEVASPETEAENASTGISAQTDTTQALDTEATIVSATELPNPPSADIEVEVPVTETDTMPGQMDAETTPDASEITVVASDSTEISSAQTDSIPENTDTEVTPDISKITVVASDNLEIPETEADATPSEITVENSETELSSLEYQTIQVEPVLPDANSFAEETFDLQQENTPDDDVPTFLTDEDVSVEPMQAVTAVAIIDAPQDPLLQGTRAILPLASIETTLSSPVGNFLLPKYSKRSPQTTTSHMAQRRRMVHKRWTRDAQDKTKRHRLYRTISITMVTVILLGLLIPLGVGLAAYNAYNNINGIAHDGINHLMSVKDLLPTSKNDITAVLDAKKLQNAQDQLKAAESDFVQLQQLADRPDIQSIVQQVAPQYSDKLGMAKHLLQVALDISRMGQELTGVGVIAANIVHASPLAASSAKPLLSVADVENIKAAVTHALYYMDDIQQNMSQVHLKDLPISAKQQTQLTSVLGQLPSIRSLIVQNQSMVDLVSWLLGVGQPRRLLIQTMDTGEIRSGGGFTGQYGILSIQNGQVAPFTLHDVNDIDYHSNGMIINRLPPPQYSWMNFGNWGLRDSNLSADYPTTAQINMQLFQEQGGGSVDGVIDFTPAFIGHIIDATGPIHVPEYNETITSANLVDKLHYYQQNYTAIGVEIQKTNSNSSSVRKAFTTLLGKLLLARVTHLSTTKLLALVKNAVKDIQSRDLEIYLANPVAEQWLTTNGYNDGMSTFSKQDGFMVVQSNMSISKASQYVHTTEQDNITLDAQGGATHALTITLDYNRAGRDVYGFGIGTYSDYMRVYMPESSQLIDGNGFDTGQPICTGTSTNSNNGNNGNNSNKPPKDTTSTCNTLPPSASLYCPNGDYNLGPRPTNLPKTADIMGEPPARTSDLPGRGMFGGMTVTPSDCTSTITLSWYVPNAVKHVGKSLVYPLLVQKQGGLVPTLQINVDASAIKGMKPFSFQGDLHADRVFNIL